MEEYKEDIESSNQKERLESVNITEADDPPVEEPPKPSLPITEMLKKAKSIYGDSEKVLELADILNQLNLQWSIYHPSLVFLRNNAIFPFLLDLTKVDEFPVLQESSLALLEFLLKLGNTFIDDFVSIKDSVMTIFSILSREAMPEIQCDVLGILYLLFDENGQKQAKKILEEHNFTGQFLEYTRNIAEMIENIDSENENELHQFQNIMNKALQFILLFLDDPEFEFSKVYDFIIPIFVSAYSHPFNELVIATLPLLDSIFQLTKNERDLNPWEILESTTLLDIICTRIQNLDSSLQDAMLQCLMYLTAQPEDDGHALILERVTLNDLFDFLMDFDKEKSVYDERFKSGCKIVANLMTFEPDALDIILSDEIHQFFVSIFEEGTSNVKQSLAFGLFALLDNLTGTDVIRLFSTDLVLNAFLSIETAQGDELYIFLSNLSRCFCHLFMVASEVQITSDYYQEFIKECSKFLHSLDTSDNSKLSLLVDSLISDYFPEENDDE